MEDIILKKPAMPLPIMKYYPNADVLVGALIRALQEKGEKLFETGRMCLIKDVQHYRLARFISECTMAIFFQNHSYLNGVISCSKLHQRLYLSCFFETYDGLNEFHDVGSATPLLPLFIFQKQKQNIPSSIKNHWQSLADEFTSSGSILFRQKSPALLETSAI